MRTPPAYDAEFGPALRVALALRAEHGEQAIGDFYAAFGTRMWETPAPDGEPLPNVPELTRLALADIGIDRRLRRPGARRPGELGRRAGRAPPLGAAAAGLRRAHADLRRRCDRDGAGGSLANDGDGPATAGRTWSSGRCCGGCRPTPTALALWRHLRGLARLGTVYELKRYKSLHSRADLPNAVPRADLRVADMRAARAADGRTAGRTRAPAWSGR